MFGKTAEALREYAKRFSMTDFEKKVSDALSNENWGTPNSTLLELASASSNFNDYLIITRELFLALDERSERWRRIFKALVLLEFLFKFGNPRVLDEVSQRQVRLKNLAEFRFFEDGRDRASGIKEKSAYILRLCNDRKFLEEEKEKAASGKDRYVGVASSGEVRNFVGAGARAGGAAGSGNYSGASLRQETVTTERLERLRKANAGSSVGVSPAMPVSAVNSKGSGPPGGLFTSLGVKETSPKAPQIDLLGDFDNSPSRKPVEFDFGDFQAAPVQPPIQPTHLTYPAQPSTRTSTNPFDFL